MIDTPTTNIEVKMEIPAARYIGRTQEIMSQYGDVVEDAMKENYSYQIQGEVSVAFSSYCGCRSYSA